MAQRQFIVLRLGEQDFCAPVEQVLSINEMTSLSKLPNAPSYIEGIMNLRGEIIPVVNLKKRFGMAETDKAERILVSNNMVGFLADDASNSEVTEDENIKEPPVIGMDADNEFISGVLITNDKLMLIVDLDKVVSKEIIDELMEETR